jgi:hypothetical protein
LDDIKTGCQPDQYTTQGNKAERRPGFHVRGLKSAATATASAATSEAAALAALAAEHAA